MTEIKMILITDKMRLSMSGSPIRFQRDPWVDHIAMSVRTSSNYRFFDEVSDRSALIAKLEADVRLCVRPCLAAKAS